MKNKNCIFVKTNKGETSLENLCNDQYEKILSLMHSIENEFNTSLHEHPELRHKILDIGNFVKRIPLIISEVI